MKLRLAILALAILPLPTQAINEAVFNKSTGILRIPTLFIEGERYTASMKKTGKNFTVINFKKLGSVNNEKVTYTFDESTNLTVVDLSGNNRHGTLLGPGRAAGRVGQGLIFERPETRLTVPDLGEFKANEMTIEAWLSPTDAALTSTQQIIGDGYYGIKSFRLRLVNGKLQLQFHNSLAWNTVIDGLNALAPDQWSHVAVTYSNCTASTYINGALDNQRSACFRIQSSENTLFAGATDDSNFRWIDQYYGKMDELTVLERAMTAEEINSTYLAAP